MQDIPRASIKDLAHTIKGYGTPRFAFFLGAGASKQSGIPTANDMIRHFKEQVIARLCPYELKTDAEKTNWLMAQDWYQSDGSEYGRLFEKFEPRESGRHLYIESIIEERTPSFGYFVLANLMASNYVNTIITTNFDDLVYSSCLTYTLLRPIVYAYGTFASAMRSPITRPKILKLHGDYLITKLRNLDSETEQLDPNMCNQVRQILMGYDLVVVGYSGGDLSIINTLAEMPEENTLYWCIRRGEQINKSVEKLLREKRGFLIEIEGFDEMMNEVRRIVEFDVRRMLEAFEERRYQIIKQLEKFEPQFSAEILGEIVETIKGSDTRLSESRKVTALDFAVKAYRAEEANDLYQAEEFYRKAIELDANNAVAYNNLGSTLFNLKRYEEAEKLCRKAIEIDPNYALPYNNLGNVLNDLKRYDEAEAAYRKAIKSAPNYAKVHNNLGHMLNESKRYREAEIPLRNAIEIDPDYALAYINLGRTLSELKRYDEAETILRRAIKLDPFNAMAHSNLGNARNNLKRYDEAEAAYRKAIEIDPGYTLAYNNLGSVLNNLKRYEEAEAVLCKAIELAPCDVMAHSNLGNVLNNLKRYDKAEAALCKAIEFDPSYTLAYSNLGNVLNNLKRYEEAEDAYHKAIEIDPSYIDAYNGLSIMQRLLGKDAEALTSATIAHRLAVNSPIYLLALASIYKKLGQQTESSQYAGQARKLFKHSDWYKLACLESVCGNTDAAIENLRRATQQKKLNPDWVRRDPDLEWIRDDPRFKEIVGEESV